MTNIGAGENMPEDAGQAAGRELHARFSGQYNEFFDTKPGTDWVMITDDSAEILGGGTDSQIPGERALSTLERTIGQTVHLFGKPEDIGSDGWSPFPYEE